MNKEQSIINGFLKAAMAKGYTQHEALEICKQANTLEAVIEALSRGAGKVKDFGMNRVNDVYNIPENFTKATDLSKQLNPLRAKSPTLKGESPELTAFLRDKADEEAKHYMGLAKGVGTVGAGLGGLGLAGYGAARMMSGNDQQPSYKQANLGGGS